jgi:hypothetical protein
MNGKPEAAGSEDNHQRHREADKCLEKHDFPRNQQERSGFAAYKGKGNEGH